MRISALLFFLVFLPATAFSALQTQHVTQIPVERPLQIALDDDGRMYITTSEGSVRIAETYGTASTTLQNKDKNGAAILKKPSGIAVFKGTIYVADRSLDKIVLFSRDGVYSDSFSGSGSGPGELSNPRGIFVNRGVIYVADYSNDRIQMFGANGVFLGSLGITDDRETAVKSPVEVVVDPYGLIYVIDDSSQVKVFRPDGTFARKLSGVTRPRSLAVAPDGILVADQENGSIVKFSFSGERVTSFGSQGDGKGQFREISGMVADSIGNIHIADTKKEMVQIIAAAYASNVESVDVAPPPPSVLWSRDIMIQSPRVFWDATGERLYTIDEKKEEVHAYKGDTIELTLKVDDWTPVSVKVDRQGSAWVVDRGESRIIKFDGSGKPVLKFGTSGSGPGSLSKPRDVAISRDGTVYVADTGNDRIQVFSGSGVFLNSVGAAAGIPGLRNPTALDVDDDGNLFILSSSVPYLLRVAADGKVLGKVGETPEGPGKLREPVALSIAGNELMVVDADTHSIKVFRTDGTYLRSFGSKGEAKGSFRKPAAIAVIDPTRLLVSDYGNKRLQMFTMTHTAAPPTGLTATPGMRTVKIGWKYSPELYVSSYKVFRAAGKPEHFKEIATVTGNNYRDNAVEPVVQYFYKLGAVAQDGNCTVAGDTISGIPVKYKSTAPKGLRSTSQEWSVDLAWEGDQDPYTSHFIVYRQDGAEKDKPAKVGETRVPSFSEGQLEADTPYIYFVAAVSTDGIESEPVSIKTRTIVATKPPIQLDVIDISNVFSNTYKIYETEGVGKILLTNNTRTRIESLKLSFTIKSFMDFPSEVEIRDLPPQSKREIPIKAVFNNKILEVSEDTPVQAELMVSYYENQKQRTFSKSHTITLYEKHRMMWIEKDRVATFITPKDPALLEFARSVVTQYGDVKSPLVFASALFDYLGYMGMTYLQHPTNPYQITEGKAAYVDYVQYPRDTLKRNSGVCTDLVVLFAASMESLGVRTMLLGIPGHLFMMFSLGTVDELGNDTMGDLLVQYDDELWVPVELTTVGSSFMKSWEQGSKTYQEKKAQGSIDYTDLRVAWERYKPATLPFTDWRVQSVPRGVVDKHFNNEMYRISKIALKYMSIRHFQAFVKNPGDYNALMQIGIIYGEGGDTEEAIRYLEKARALAPKNAAILNNLGNINFIKSDYREAARYYQQAAELDATDPLIQINLTKCYLSLDQRDKAGESFRKAIALDKEIPRKYRGITIELMGSF